MKWVSTPHKWKKPLQEVSKGTECSSGYLSGLHRLGRADFGAPTTNMRRAWKYKAHYLAKKMHRRMEFGYLPVFLMKMPVLADANESDKAHGSTYTPDTPVTPV